jgi:hypothetical protein
MRTGTAQLVHIKRHQPVSDKAQHLDKYLLIRSL